MPSTAESTEIAGVMTASPKNSEAPTMPMARMIAERFGKLPRASAISDSTPPSPRLSARSTNMMYLIVTVIVSDQMISDSTPRMSPRSATLPPDEACNASRKA